MSERYYIKKQFISAAVDAYCSCASRIEDKLSSEIVDTLGQFTELETPFDPAPLLQMACLNVALNLTFSQRFDPSGRVAKEILRTFECRYAVVAVVCVLLCLSFHSVVQHMYLCCDLCLSVSFCAVYYATVSGISVFSHLKSYISLAAAAASAADAFSISSTSIISTYALLLLLLLCFLLHLLLCILQGSTVVVRAQS